jgi:hypothetical protein
MMKNIFWSMMMALFFVGSSQAFVNKVVVYKKKSDPSIKIHCMGLNGINGNFETFTQRAQLNDWLTHLRSSAVSLADIPSVIAQDPIFTIDAEIMPSKSAEKFCNEYQKMLDTSVKEVQFKLLNECRQKGIQTFNLECEQTLLWKTLHSLSGILENHEWITSKADLIKAIETIYSKFQHYSVYPKIKNNDKNIGKDDNPLSVLYEQLFCLFYEDKNNIALLEKLKQEELDLKEIHELMTQGSIESTYVARILLALDMYKDNKNTVLLYNAEILKQMHSVLLAMGYEVERFTEDLSGGDTEHEKLRMLDIAEFYGRSSSSSSSSRISNESKEEQKDN